MTAYESTRVPVAQSKGAIEGLLSKRGVTDTRFTTTASLFAVEFNWPVREKTGECSGANWVGCEVYGNKRHRRHDNYRVKYVLGVRMVAPLGATEVEQRRIVRVLFWHIKSKLEVVESGVVAFEQEFLPHLTLGRGRTVYDTFKPMLDAAIAEKKDLSVVMEGIVGQTAHEALPPPRRPRPDAEVVDESMEAAKAKGSGGWS